MEDENGLELSLGLSCVGSSAKVKGKSENSSDTKTEEGGDKKNKLGNDFKTFLHAAAPKQDLGSDSSKPPQNFFNNLSKAVLVDEDRKRMIFFDDPNHKRKRERDSDQHEKAKTSHVSLTTEDGSTAENEDVAESGVEDLTSKLVSHPDGGPKQFIGVGGSSDVRKEIRGYADSSSVDLQAKKRFNNGPSVGASGASTTPTPPFPGVMQVMPAENGGRSGNNQAVAPGNSPLMFGYSHVQLPLLDKENSSVSVSHQQQLHPSFVGKAATHVTSHNASEAAQYNMKKLQHGKGDGKQRATEEGSLSQTEDVKGSSTNLRAKDAPDRSAAESYNLDFSAIKPGISADLKFGGCGSQPNLPWVSTTAPGPKCRTISGVTYRFNTNQIKIVCACHGTHMSPEEFVRHAAERHSQDNGTVLASFPSNNPAASARS